MDELQATARTTTKIINPDHSRGTVAKLIESPPHAENTSITNNMDDEVGIGSLHSTYNQ